MPVLPLEKVPEDGHAPGRYALYCTFFYEFISDRFQRVISSMLFEQYPDNAEKEFSDNENYN